MPITPGPPSGGRETDHSPAKKPSLVDDLFLDPTKREKEAQQSRVDEELSHPPSLVADVFQSGPPKAKKRIPVWFFVFAAIIVSVCGSVLVYRSNSAAPPIWKEEPKPKLEMATPPPVPPLPGEPEAEPAKAVTVTPKPSVQKQPLLQRPIKPAQAPIEPETTKLTKPPASSGTGTGTETKPKLLREPEDLAKEQRAFDLLREKSQAARQLLEGNLEQYRFLEYQVIPQEAGQYWVDLVAEQKGAGRAVHFIWTVNPDRQTAKALSQAARDLDH
ncbi:MAG: hypothetical protein EHM18_03135 [Acidobacteria bacterium]|nr:MAG: hypothetical protein EHM18_03135 [Acidobacteriota bacterium]